MKLASVYAVRGELLFVPSSATTDEIWCAHGPWHCLPDKAPDEALGMLMRETLQASREGLPPSAAYGPADTAIPAAAGFRTWGAFSKQARTISVCALLADEYKLVPYARRRPRAGHERMNDAVFRTHAVTPQALGEALRRALALAR